MAKKSFVIYENWCELFCNLPNEEAGNLIKNICNYKLNKDLNKDSPVVNAIFEMIKITLDEDEKKYQETCEKRRNSGSIGGKQKVANAKQNVANASKCLAKGSKWVANCSDNDNDNDNDNNKSIITTTFNRNKTEAKKVIELYHSHCPSLPKVSRVTDNRIKSVMAILKDYSEEEITDMFDKAERSRFLREGTEKWSGADFEWLMNPQNFIKVAEGKYEDRTANAGMQKTTYNFNELRKMIDGG